MTYSEDGATTKVRVRGAQTPTFTVYKLEKPSRVVVDLPRARLSEAMRGHENAHVQTASTWSVNTIAAQQMDDGGQLVRVIVAMARPGRYDVKTEGNEVIVMVTARDAAPAKVDADALVKAQAEADRLRKVAADQAARADAAQKAADEARRQGQLVKAAELDKVKAEAQKAKDIAAKAMADAQAVAARAKQETDAARADANRAKQETDAARADANRAKQETDAARADANRAKQDSELARKEMERAKQAADAAKIAAQREATAVKLQSQRDADVAKAEAEAAKREADRIKAEAAVAQAAAAKQIDAANKAKAEADKARREAQVARDLAAKSKADADAARKETDRLKADADRARADADAAQKQVAQRQADIDKVKREADAARADAIAAKADAVKARAEADDAKRAAESAKIAAAADRKKAEIARDEADKKMREAKQQLAMLDTKAQQIQALEDKARAANAAAEARDQVARDELAKAKKEREVAEAAAKVAAAQLANARTADRQKMELESKLAQERLDKARKATADAEARRIAAENAAQEANKNLQTTRAQLAGVEQQRTQAESQANDAARKRSEAEAAAVDAQRRRSEAEIAATDAMKRRQEAEQLRDSAQAQRKQAEDAAKVAKAAAEAADKQRVIAEKSLRDATAAKKQAEKSLDELTTRRLAAEHAAVLLEAKMKDEAKKQAELAAAKARKASEADLDKLRGEATKLADDRKRAESELADRRKAVATQQQQVVQLEAAALKAKDEADREEARRAKLVAQRQAEEAALAKLRAERDAATKVAVKAPAPAPVPAPKAAPAPAPAPNVVATKKGMVNDVTFKGSEGSGDVAIAMTGDAKVQLGAVTATHVELVIDNADLATRLERKLDVSKFGSPVKSVSSFRDRHQADRVRLIAEVSGPVTPMIDRDASGVHWRFITLDTVAQKKPAPPRTQVVPPQVVGGFGAASTPLTQQSVTQVVPGQRRQRVYRGATVDFDFKDAPLPDLLRIIADTGRVNIVVPDTLSNVKVTVRLKRVPWDQALDVILASHGLGYRVQGNLFRVADRKDLDKEDKEAAERAELERKRETPRPEVVRLNYADAKDLKPKLAGMVSPNGSIEVDERQNALIINDVAGNRAQIQQLALSLDTQTPQISIEARIVEARSTFLRQIGVQWGGRALATAEGGNTTGLVFPNNVQIRGGNEDQQTRAVGVAAPSDFAVNLPAAVATGEGGAIGMTFGSIGGNFALNLRLSALEDTGTVRIISAPKITVLNNKQATITQGVSIPIQVVSAAGTQTQLVQADLSLEVTPYVSSRDCAVQMKLKVTKNEPDFVNVGARGDPSFLRKEATTTMLVQDGDTSVLGGIYTRNSGLAYKKIPFFGDLPVLGWFFKNRRENDDRTEILVFVTPKITNRANLACQ